MAWLAPIIGGVLSAGGSIGSKFVGGGGGDPSVHTEPLPPYAHAINRYIGRLFALNATAVPPSFGDYISSGGTATFPIQDPGMGIQERQALGLLDKFGQSVPFTSIDEVTQPLSPEQQLYLGYLRSRQGKDGPLAHAWTLSQRAERASERGNDRRAERLTSRYQDILNRRLP